MEPKEPGYTFLVVPDSGEGEVRQYAISKTALRKWATVVSVVVGVLLCSLLLLVFNIGRLRSYDAVVDENLALRESLGALQGTVEDAEALIGRFRLSDAQIRDVLSEDILPGFGPMSEEDMAALGLAENLGDEPWLGEDGDPMEEVDGSVAVEDVRPVSLWASEIQERLELVLRLMEQSEPRVADAADELEDLSALRLAFPQVWPVNGSLTSGFGYRRSPISRTRKLHAGIDVAAPRGTPVYAVASGWVQSARYNSGYGRILVIDHGFGIETLYAHNSSLLVRKGERVEAGQLIATVGSTGQSTGPHLHFELLIDGQAVDPLDYLPR
ncbi:MAG: M23 family metallopeptidase [Myxococcota bacterium]|nr:M23 family metallopeptidase [Myxococcota bacterium]